MALWIRTSKTRSIGNRPPVGSFCLNKDSWQAQGLQVWVPLFGATPHSNMALRPHQVTRGSAFSNALQVVDGMTGVSFSSNANDWLKVGYKPTSETRLMCAWGVPDALDVIGAIFGNQGSARAALPG